MDAGYEAVQEYTREEETDDPVTVRLDSYDVERLRDRQEGYDLFEGVKISETDIEVFAEVYGDDQDLHVGDDAERKELDDEYGIFAMFDRADEAVIVPGAQLFNLAMQTLDDVEAVDEASFDEAVYAGETVRLQERESSGVYVLERDAGNDVEEVARFRVEHGTDNGELFRTLVSAGMGFWDRTGDVLMGYADMEVDEGFDLDDRLVFTREASDGRDIGPGRLQHYRNRFEDEGGEALTYTVTNLHLQ